MFTEVDRLVAAGGVLSGTHWGRGEDRIGVAVALNGLSAPHREYLAAGGAGFLIGDGRLDYAAEQILECYYRVNVAVFPARLRVQLSPDLQYIRNPGFNRDRGPVSFVGVRFHVEY